MKIIRNSHFKKAEQDRLWFNNWVKEVEAHNGRNYERLEVYTTLGKTHVWGLHTKDKTLETLVVFPGARTTSLFYFLLATSHCLAGILRGAGKTDVPMFVMLISWCLIRISYITIAVKLIPDIRVIYWAYPLTWTISSIIFIIYSKKTNWLMSYENS